MADERRDRAPRGDDGVSVEQNEASAAGTAPGDAARATKRRGSVPGGRAKAGQGAGSGWAANAGRGAASGAVRGAALGALGGAAGAGAVAGGVIGGLKGLFSDDSDHDKG